MAAQQPEVPEDFLVHPHPIYRDLYITRGPYAGRDTLCLVCHDQMAADQDILTHANGVCNRSFHTPCLETTINHAIDNDTEESCVNCFERLERHPPEIQILHHSELSLQRFDERVRGYLDDVHTHTYRRILTPARASVIAMRQGFINAILAGQDPAQAHVQYLKLVHQICGDAQDDGLLELGKQLVGEQVRKRRFPAVWFHDTDSDIVTLGGVVRLPWLHYFYVLASVITWIIFSVWSLYEVKKQYMDVWRVGFKLTGVATSMGFSLTLVFFVVRLFVVFVLWLLGRREDVQEMWRIW